MEKRRFLTTILAVCMLLALAVPAFALEYTFDEDEQSGYGKPTSVDPVVTADGGAQKNEDVSKNAAIIPPSFGTPTSNTLNTGEYLTPNLVPSAMPATGATVNGDFVVVFPPDMSGLSAESVPADLAAGSTMVPGSADVTVTVPESTSSGYTEVTDDLYYKDGSLGTLEIPAIGLTVKVYQGTDSAALKKGAGHFTNTSIWDGNAGFAAHNRGANSYFGKIHTLELGDRITLTTTLGTRSYVVASVEKVSINDSSGTAPTTDNRVTLYTCVMDQPEYRWCVTAVQEIV